MYFLFIFPEAEGTHILGIFNAPSLAPLSHLHANLARHAPREIYEYSPKWPWGKISSSMHSIAHYYSYLNAMSLPNLDRAGSTLVSTSETKHYKGDINPKLRENVSLPTRYEKLSHVMRGCAQQAPQYHTNATPTPDELQIRPPAYIRRRDSPPRYWALLAMSRSVAPA